MCIIIDTNRKHLYLSEVGENVFVREWVKKRGRLIVCAELLGEYGTVKSTMREHVVALKDRDKVRELTRSEMNEGREILQRMINNKKIPQLSENDHHILAMAAYSKCELIFTDDTDLIHDFKKIIGGRIVPLGENGKRFLWQKSCD